MFHLKRSPSDVPACQSGLMLAGIHTYIQFFPLCRLPASEKTQIKDQKGSVVTIPDVGEKLIYLMLRLLLLLVLMNSVPVRPCFCLPLPALFLDSILYSALDTNCLFTSSSMVVKCLESVQGIPQLP